MSMMSYDDALNNALSHMEDAESLLSPSGDALTNLESQSAVFMHSALAGNYLQYADALLKEKEMNSPPILVTNGGDSPEQSEDFRP